MSGTRSSAVTEDWQRRLLLHRQERCCCGICSHENMTRATSFFARRGVRRSPPRVGRLLPHTQPPLTSRRVITLTGFCESDFLLPPPDWSICNFGAEECDPFLALANSLAPFKSGRKGTGAQVSSCVLRSGSSVAVMLRETRGRRQRMAFGVLSRTSSPAHKLASCSSLF